MSSEIKDALEKILLSVVQHPTTDEKLHLFCPMRGVSSHGKFMLVGRALYGWHHEFTAAEMSDRATRAKCVQSSCEFSSLGSDPIQHLHDGWVQNRKAQKRSYNPARSSFWSVGKEVLGNFRTAEERQTLLSHLYWTNLYKLSRFPIGNPGSTLQEIQRPACMEMLQTEIRLIAPQQILFLTGWWWADPFLNFLNYEPREQNIGKHVFRTGFLRINEKTRCSIVVADHPERKKRENVIRNILTAFDKLAQV